MSTFAQLQRRPQSTHLASPARPERTNAQPAPVAHPLLAQQQAWGNQAVQRLLRARAVQTKLTVNEPGDKFEQEADRVSRGDMDWKLEEMNGVPGQDIHVGPGQEKHLPHEAWHEVQQGRVKPTMQAKLIVGPPDLGISSGAPRAVQRKPSQVTAHRFLGLNIRGGVNSRLASRLDDVEDQLRLDYQAVHGTPATNDTVVRNWAGINSMRGWRQRIPRPGRPPQGASTARVPPLMSIMTTNPTS